MKRWPQTKKCSNKGPNGFHTAAHCSVKSTVQSRHFRPLPVGELHWNLHRESPPQAAQRQCQTRPVDAKSKEIPVITLPLKWWKKWTRWNQFIKNIFQPSMLEVFYPIRKPPHPLVKIPLHGALDWRPTKDGREPLGSTLNLLVFFVPFNQLFLCIGLTTPLLYQGSLSPRSFL